MYYVSSNCQLHILYYQTLYSITILKIKYKNDLMCRCRNALLMIKIHGKLFSLRATMKNICDDVNSVTWLFQITIFFCADHI
jgi:hypothetical protein